MRIKIRLVVARLSLYRTIYCRRHLSSYLFFLCINISTLSLSFVSHTQKVGGGGIVLIIPNVRQQHPPLFSLQQMLCILIAFLFNFTLLHLICRHLALFASLLLFGNHFFFFATVSFCFGFSMSCSVLPTHFADISVDFFLYLAVVVRSFA